MEKYDNQLKKSKDSTRAREPERSEDVVRELLEQARHMDWKNTKEVESLRQVIMRRSTFGKRGDKVLLQLISHTELNPDDRNGNFWDTDAGLSLLSWLLRDPDLSKVFINQPANLRGEDEMSGKLPIHSAIRSKNFNFLAAFLRICYDSKFDQNQDQNFLQLPERVFEFTETVPGDNCLHLAMNVQLPFAPFMVAVCSEKALTDTDADGYTPLHRAMTKMNGQKTYLISLPPHSGSSVKRDDGVQGNQKGESGPRMPVWDKTFRPTHVFEEIKQRKDADKILPLILTTTNKHGKSPYKEDLDKYNEPGFKGSFKNLIFQKVREISRVSRALYGISGGVKELCLDMSDFNQSSHNFEDFVERLNRLQEDEDDTTADQDDAVDQDDTVEQDDYMDQDENNDVLQFEDTLFFVQLPDLNYVKQPCPHTTLGTLFSWLRDKKGVRTIKKLIIPDNTVNPMNSAFFGPRVLNKFEIEALDWRKLDMSLDILTGIVGTPNPNDEDSIKQADQPRIRNSLKELTLYSSGNWSVLYHWISKDGLAKLPNLRDVRIEIIHLDRANGVHDKEVHDRHRDLAKRYKAALESHHAKNKELPKDRDINFNYKLNVRVDAKWYYPQPPRQGEEPTARVPMHHFTGQLGPCRKFLDEQQKKNAGYYDNMNGKDRNEISGIGYEASRPNEDKYARYTQNFQAYSLPPMRKSLRPDNRIKVAIIDNGTDRIRASIGEMIAKGISFVTADSSGSDRILPWWMVSDSHGTYMASLIGQINPYCRLYIARVGKGRNDIDPKNGAKAIRWALEQKVDIISMSWTTRKKDGDLEKAINEAANGLKCRPTLMFCSTSDEGMYSGSIWPADYHDKVVKVSATDRWGHITPQAQGSEPVDIQIPGENIEASGATYIGTALPTVSGSSVATALAAGIASLALLLLRTYNNLNDAQMNAFYTKSGILRVFKKMDADKGGIQLSKLFPRDTTDDDNTHQMLAANWKVANLPK